MSCTRNFGLWNLYKSELDGGDMEGGPLVRYLVVHLYPFIFVKWAIPGHRTVFLSFFPFLVSHIPSHDWPRNYTGSIHFS